jgi:epoxyqueuosine reductase
MKKLLLHTCCAPCAIYPLQELAKEYEVTIYFYDPNIHPEIEYIQRRDELKNYAKTIGAKWEEGVYDEARWFAATKGLENEPERGKRCTVCFDMRLGETARKAKNEGYDLWATALSISPHKDTKQIHCVARLYEEKYKVPFLDIDWKKKDGFKIATKLAKEQNFYRQDYCGCVYSKIARAKQKS